MNGSLSFWPGASHSALKKKKKSVFYNVNMLSKSELELWKFVVKDNTWNQESHGFEGCRREVGGGMGKLGDGH